MSATEFRDHLVTTEAQLADIYETPVGNALTKEIDHINAPYAELIEASPFFALATCGPDGMDCSPRGDAPGFVRVHDEHTLLIPDRRGNNRIDSLKNLVHDPRVALMFLIPGCGETIRIIGRAAISADPELRQSFEFAGKLPRIVLVVTVERVYYQCPKAIVRSKIWDTATWIDRKTLPTSGKILAAITDGQAGGDKHDAAYPEYLKATLY